jgi:hypothetical protein
MLKFAADENFNNDIIRGILRHLPAVDIVRVQDTELAARDDPSVLEWASQEGRILLTHDVQTMTKHGYERIRAELPMPGIFEVDDLAPLAVVIDDLLLLIECSIDNEWNNKICYVPLH